MRNLFIAYHVIKFLYDAEAYKARLRQLADTPSFTTFVNAVVAAEALALDVS